MPSYNPIQDRPLPSPRFSGGGPSVKDIASSFQAPSGLADTASAIGQKEQKAANDAKLIGVDSELINFKNDQLWNQDYGAYQQKGENALSVVDSYGQKFDKKIEEIASSLNNEDQRQAFKQRSSQLKNEFSLDLEKHTYTEGEKLADEKYKMGQDTYKNDAALNFNNPGKIQSNLALTEGLVRNEMQRKGITDEALISNAVVDAKGQIHAAVIERASNTGQDQFAQGYFNANKKELGDKLIPVEKTLEEATTLGSAQRQRDAIISKGLGATDAYDQVRKIKDPKTQQKTEELVRQFYSEKASAIEQQQKQLFNDSSNIIDQTKNADAIPRSQWAQLQPSQKTSLLEYAERLNKGVEPPANGDLFQQYTLMASNPDSRDLFKTTNLREKLQGKVTQSELKGFIETQGKLIEKDGGTSALLDYTYGNQKIVRDTMDQIGEHSWFGLGGVTDESRVRINAQISQAVKQKEQAVGRQITADEMQDIANRFATQVAVSRNGLHQIAPTKPIGNLVPADLTIEEVPSDVKSNLQTILQQKGWPLTEQNIIQFYIKGLQSGAIKAGAK